jgi:hypothetical protein
VALVLQRSDEYMKRRTCHRQGRELTTPGLVLLYEKFAQNLLLVE